MIPSFPERPYQTGWPRTRHRFISLATSRPRPLPVRNRIGLGQLQLGDDVVQVSHSLAARLPLVERDSRRAPAGFIGFDGACCGVESESPPRAQAPEPVSLWAQARRRRPHLAVMAILNRDYPLPAVTITGPPIGPVETVLSRAGRCYIAMSAPLG
jgi:hypothetical protein